MQAFERCLSNEDTEMGRAEAEKLLSIRLRNQDFRNDRETLLCPGLMKFDVDEAADVVRSAYLVHLSGD